MKYFLGTVRFKTDRVLHSHDIFRLVEAENRDQAQEKIQKFAEDYLEMMKINSSALSTSEIELAYAQPAI